MAWINATVWREGKPTTSRRRDIELLAMAANQPPDYGIPDAGLCSYIVDMLHEVGEGVVSAGKLSAIGWHDIEAWRRCTGAIIDRGEAMAIKRLSQIYVDQFYKSEAHDCPSPLVRDVTDDQRAKVSDSFRSFFQVLAKK